LSIATLATEGCGSGRPKHPAAPVLLIPGVFEPARLSFSVAKRDPFKLLAYPENAGYFRPRRDDEIPDVAHDVLRFRLI
jgi:hypothetical protein